MHPDLTVLHAVVDQATKESAAAKKAFTEALHTCQKNEEFTSFIHEDSSLGPESEDDGDHQPFTAVMVNSSICATPKTTYRNGNWLVHCVNKTPTLCYDFSYFVLFTYVFSLFLEVSHGAATLTHFSLTHTVALP